MKQFGLSILFICGLAACPAPKEISSQSNSQSSEQKVDYFADNGFGNAVAIVQHPAGEHHNGITYVTYQGPLEDPYIAAYNHASKTWAGPFKAGVSDMGKDPTRKIDNHGKPTMIIDDAGYIHIFFGGHGGTPDLGKNTLGNHHYGRNIHVVSKRPLDITEWEELDTIPPFGTYNQVVKMDNGDIFLFYRHGAHRSDWVYHVSTDNGRSFSEPVSFLKHKRREDVAAVDSWYPWIGRGQGDEIIVSFDYHLCWDRDARTRGHTANREDLYYMVFDTKTRDWRNVKGEKLNMPLIREEADEKARVADSGELWTFNGAAALDPSGRPHIVINEGVDIGRVTGGPKRITHYRWDGEAWRGGTKIGPSGGRADISVTSDTDVNLLTTYRDSQGNGLMTYWHSKNAGDSFEKGKELLRREKASFAISSFIRNAHPDARMIVAERPENTNDRRMYLIGDNGPIGRIASEAAVK